MQTIDNVAASSVIQYEAGGMRDADGLITEHHYSGRPPRIPIFVGLAKHNDKTMAACVFCVPNARWAENVIELSRLVREPDCNVPLSGLISWCMRELKKQNKHHLAVSYADKTHSHHGGIYQAASWHYNGARRPVVDGVIVDGQFMPKRSVSSAHGTFAYERLKEIWPTSTIEMHKDKGKHLYWKPLTKEGKRRAQRLGLKSVPYPKPDWPSREHK